MAKRPAAPVKTEQQPEPGPETIPGPRYCSEPKALRAFSLMQERWVVFIVASLLSEPLGFNELSRRATGVNPATLKQRLCLLEEEGVITKTVLSTMPPRTEYRLTKAGERLRTVIDALARWGIDNYAQQDSADGANKPARDRKPRQS